VAFPGVPPDPRNSLLFHTQLLFQPPLASPVDDWSLHAMDADVRDAVGSANFDISMELEERNDGQVVGGFVFSTDLFDRETARDMASHWCRLLDAIAAEPEMPMVQHDPVTPDQRQRQLSWNQSFAEGISPQCVHEVVSSQVERAPDAVAVHECPQVESLCEARESTPGQQAVATLPRPLASARSLLTATPAMSAGPT